MNPFIGSSGIFVSLEPDADTSVRQEQVPFGIVKSAAVKNIGQSKLVGKVNKNDGDVQTKTNLAADGACWLVTLDAGGGFLSIQIDCPDD